MAPRIELGLAMENLAAACRLFAQISTQVTLTPGHAQITLPLVAPAINRRAQIKPAKPPANTGHATAQRPIGPVRLADGSDPAVRLADGARCTPPHQTPGSAAIRILSTTGFLGSDPTERI